MLLPTLFTVEGTRETEGAQSSGSQASDIDGDA